MSAAEALNSLYRRILSPLLHSGSGAACRFQPTCSEYASIAVSEYGWLRGGFMAACRFLRCHPFARGGWDPVAPNPHHAQARRQVR